MTADELRRRGEQAGFDHEEVVLADRWEATVARRSRFRVQWIFTRMHAFVFTIEVDHLGEDEAEALFDATARYAKEHKDGLPRGLQTGAVAIPLVVAQSIGDGACDEIRSPDKRFAIINFPAAVVGDEGELVMRDERLLWGLLYDTFFRDAVADHLDRPVPRPAPWVVTAAGWAMTTFFVLTVVLAILSFFVT